MIFFYQEANTKFVNLSCAKKSVKDQTQFLFYSELNTKKNYQIININFEYLLEIKNIFNFT